MTFRITPPAKKPSYCPRRAEEIPAPGPEGVLVSFDEWAEYKALWKLETERVEWPGFGPVYLFAKPLGDQQKEKDDNGTVS